jgi:hypothetical protein
MTGSISTRPVLDGSGALLPLGGRFFDVSGIGAGPWVPVSLLYDPVSGAFGTIKAASTAPVAADTAVVVAVSPNGLVPVGQALSVASTPVVIASDQTAVPIKPGSTETAATGVTIGTSGVGYLGWLSSIAKLLSNSLTAAVTGAVNLVAATTGGLTETGIITTAAANVGFVKASAGQLYKVEVSNSSASWVYLKLYNSASAPTAGAGTPQRRIGVPPSSTLLTTTDIGGVYSTGIGYAITGGTADTDMTAIAAGILVNFLYK